MLKKCETPGCQHPPVEEVTGLLVLSYGTVPARRWECACGWTRLERREEPKVSVRCDSLPFELASFSAAG